MFQRLKEDWIASVQSVGLPLTVFGYLWVLGALVVLAGWILGYWSPDGSEVFYGP